MASLEELAARHAELTAADLDRLQLLLADWQLLADLSFSDLVLWLPDLERLGVRRGRADAPDDRADGLRRRPGRHVPAQGPPSGGRRGVRAPQGRVVTGHARPRALRGRPRPGPAGGIIGGRRPAQRPVGGPRRSRLEESYLEVAARLTRMVAEGTFPFPGGLGRRTPHRGSVTGSCGSTPTGVVGVRQPERAVGLPPARAGGRPGRRVAWRTPRPGWPPAAVRSTRTSPSSLAAGRPGDAEVEGEGRSCCCGRIPLLAAGTAHRRPRPGARRHRRCVGASASWSPRTRRSARSTTG